MYLTKPKSRPNRIMIADNELDTLPLYEMIHTVPDTVITIQNGGLSALRMLSKLNYDVDAIVMELVMSDLDGLSLTKEIRREEEIRSRRNPILLFWLTGEDVHNNPTLMAAKGIFRITAVFYKPQDPADIIYSVKQYL